MITRIVFVCLVILLGGFVSEAKADDPPGAKIRVQLIDGSQLLGAASDESIRVQLEFAELTIPLTKIRRVEWVGKERTTRIELENGDQLSGKVLAESMAMKAIFGKVNLPLTLLQSIERLPPSTLGFIPIRDGLVAHYSFDHGQEAIANDDASEKYNGQVKEAKWLEKGKRGGAIQFDGNSSVTIPHDKALNPSKAVSVSAWIYPRDERAGYAMIVGKTTGSSWSGGYGLVRMSGDADNVYFFVNGYTTSMVKAPVPSGAWSHLLGVCDGETVRIYLNGKEAQSIPLSPTYSAAPAAATTGPLLEVEMPLMFGSDMSQYYWKGDLDEVAIFNRALSEKEIIRIYEAGAQQLVAK